MSGADARTFDERLAALEEFVAALQAGDLEVGEAMHAYRERWRPAIAELEVELEEVRSELAEEEPDATTEGGD